MVPSRDNYRLRILPSTCKDKKALGGGGRPVIKTSAVLLRKRKGRSPRHHHHPPALSLHSRIKSRICYNLNNCAADEFKILQSYLLVGHKALLIIILEDFRFWCMMQSPPHVATASLLCYGGRRTSYHRTELRSSSNLQDAHACLTLSAAAPDNGTVRVVFNLRVGRWTGGTELKYRLQFCM